MSEHEKNRGFWEESQSALTPLQPQTAHLLGFQCGHREPTWAMLEALQEFRMGRALNKPEEKRFNVLFK